MFNKIPLRFTDLKRRLAFIRPNSQWLSHILVLILLSLCVVFFYVLVVRWIKGEFSRAVIELTQNEAFNTSKTISDLLSQTLAHPKVNPEYEDLLTRYISEFIRQNHNVVGVVISDALGRIVYIHILPQAAKSAVLQNTDQHAHALQGYDETWLLNSLAIEQPNLEPIPRSIVDIQTHQRVGSLTFLVDRTITNDAINLALTRMTGRLTMVLGAMVLFVVLAIILIQRQQRIAHRLSERRNEVERLAYVGTLAAGLAHEIRNPLNALAMQLELLEEDVGEGAPQLVAPRLKQIRKGLTGVERTVHDFLTYATPGRQQPQPVELSEIISSLCSEVSQATLEPQVRMECIAVPGLTVWCDPHALRQILGNLISNALRAQKKRPGGGQLRIEAARNGTWIDIFVDDAGNGVPREQQGRIFDCFYTTQSEGTGLGLPIARRLTDMNGGSLTVEPETSPLGGARFRLRLSSRPLPLPFGD